MFYPTNDLFFADPLSPLVFCFQVRAKLTQTCPSGCIQMRMIGVSDHFIVRPIRNHPLIFAILDLKSVNELFLEVLGVLGYKVLGSLAKVRHLRLMVRTALVLDKSILVFALLLAHLTVKLMLPKSHLLFFN